MKVTKSDILSPANAISAAGLFCTILGCLYLQRPFGVMLAIFGRALDLIDGPIARRTHTSLLGAKIDATFDKLGILALLVAVIAYQLTPLFVTGYILVQNAVTAVLGIQAHRRGVHMHSSRAGKTNVFLQSCVLLLLGCTALLDGKLHAYLSVVTHTLLAVSLYFAAMATYGYYQTTRTVSKG